MFSSILVLFSLGIVPISKFLLTSSTKFPPEGISMSNTHFITLLNLLAEEQNSREQLETFVQRLQQELTNKVDSICNCNCKEVETCDRLNNNTNRLQNELDFLRKDFDALQLQCAQVNKRLSTTENTTGRLQHDIDGLMQLKGVADLKAVFNLENKTNHLEVKVQNTEQSMQTILSSANARSQDIIGLLNKIKATDNMTLHLESEIQKSNNRLDTAVSDINSRKQDVLALVNSVEHLQLGLNDTFLKLDRMSNRAILSAYSTAGNVAASAVIPFKQVHTSHGVHNTFSVRNEGKFTCEKSGLYLISVFVSTSSNSNGYYYVYKNNTAIAVTYRHPQSTSLTSTVIVTERLQTNDMVYVRNGPEMYVYGRDNSIFSIVQIG